MLQVALPIFLLLDDMAYESEWNCHKTSERKKLSC